MLGKDEELYRLAFVSTAFSGEKASLRFSLSPATNG
jgi:hypothetical protein